MDADFSVQYVDDSGVVDDVKDEEKLFDNGLDGSCTVDYEAVNGLDAASRRQVLWRLDDANFGWFHVKAYLVSGVGFFTVYI